MTKLKKPIVLNIRQEQFAIDVVLNGGDKVNARLSAGYSDKMSKPGQSVDADNLFNHPKISLRIKELQAQQDKIAKKEFKIDSGYVLRRLKEIDDLDVIDILKDDLSGFRSLKEWPKAWRTSISAIDMKRMVNGDIESVIEKIKWPDKVKNLEMIGKHVSVKAWEKEEANTQTDMAKLLEELAKELPS